MNRTIRIQQRLPSTESDFSTSVHCPRGAGILADKGVLVGVLTYRGISILAVRLEGRAT
jgi:hypothetical protein